jgi:TrmH family RNA methyltransferase
LHHKKFRDEFGVFIGEGPKLVTQLLQNKNMVCKEIFACEPFVLENENLVNNIPVTLVSDFEMDKISTLTVAGTILGIFEKKKEFEIGDIKNKWTLMLDGIRDPGNFGTMIRTADWFGIEQMVCSNDCADQYNPKVVQSTMGSIANVHIHYTDLAAFLSSQDIKKYAATLSGKDISMIKSLKQGIIIIGNESRGIQKEILDLSDEQITIRGYGKAESLNAAVATGIILSQR